MSSILIVVIYFNNHCKYVLESHESVATTPHNREICFRKKCISQDNDLYQSAKEVIEAIQKHQCSDLRSVGVGDSNANDQEAYKLCYDFGLQSGNCLVYSFGIGDNWSFDDEMARYGCNVFSFDPSIGLKHHVRPSGVIFFPTGLKDKDGTIELRSGRKWVVRTLPTIYESLNHSNVKEFSSFLFIYFFLNIFF